MERDAEPLIGYHRSTAKRARRFAETVNDKQTITALTDMAKENDDDADRLEADAENTSRSFDPPR